MARFTRKIKIYVFILTPGRRTGEILVEQTDGKKSSSDQSNPRCACAPRVNNVHVHLFSVHVISSVHSKPQMCVHVVPVYTSVGLSVNLLTSDL